eukprot:CAMPEP_0118980070 /NCGR_PEP_ID=MMETSP1173-20130426/27480_1 /TAXON_ID=1034831 /ORGANISM="Rhizochromulina marina cf, Strain CCMP1243" /LENGTH=267 /DNA_ID=CAMNT_0006930389 /DNA_START=1 /DNA_END=804 /DNA_ORIENTATION=+
MSVGLRDSALALVAVVEDAVQQLHGFITTRRQRRPRQGLTGFRVYRPTETWKCLSMAVVTVAILLTLLAHEYPTWHAWAVVGVCMVQNAVSARYHAVFAVTRKVTARITTCYLHDVISIIVNSLVCCAVLCFLLLSPATACVSTLGVVAIAVTLHRAFALSPEELAEPNWPYTLHATRAMTGSITAVACMIVAAVAVAVAHSHLDAALLWRVFRMAVAYVLSGVFQNFASPHIDGTVCHLMLAWANSETVSFVNKISLLARSAAAIG